ncbi:hypothetical protein B0H14DRAFT_3446713 [Mycena olivaceomarginata]|nr:hypothetical protein B0H14DRAFT_3446713 [Mycena olivaceomarginata]
MLPPKKSVLAWTSIFLALASQVSAFAPASGSTVSIKGRNDDDGSLVARKAPSIAQLAAKNKGKKVVFAACAKDSECQQEKRLRRMRSRQQVTQLRRRDVARLQELPCRHEERQSQGGPPLRQAAAFAAQLDKLPFKPAKRDIDDADESDDDDDDSTASQSLEARKAPSIAQLAAKNKGKKVVFAVCAKDSECQQGCCGFKTGKCAGPDVAQTNGSGGCGRGNKSPNCDVATLLGFKNCLAGTKNGNLKAAATQQAAAFAAQLDKLPFKPAQTGYRYVPALHDADESDDDDSTASQPLEARKAPSIAQLAAKNKGKKVVFAACAKDSECQQGCCGFKTGKCAGPDCRADKRLRRMRVAGNKSPNCDRRDVARLQELPCRHEERQSQGGRHAAGGGLRRQLDKLPFKPSKRDIADESVEELPPAERYSSKENTRLACSRPRETALELEAREDDDDDEFDDDDDEFEEDQ